MADEAKQSRLEEVTLRLNEQVSSPADRATGALGRLEAKVFAEVTALGRLETALASAKAELKALQQGNAQGVVDINAYRAQSLMVKQLTAETAGQRAGTNALITTLKKLRGEQDEGKNSGSSAKKSLQELALASRVLGGEAGITTSRMASFGASLLGLTAETAGVAIVFIAATAAITAFVAAIVMGIRTSDEYRTKILDLSTAGVTLWNAQRASIAAATELNDKITQVAASSAIARDKVSQYAVAIKNSMFLGKQLFTNEQASKVLSTAALVAAGGNDALAKAYIASARGAQLYGYSLDKLNERMKLKFGAVAEARLLSLDVQLTKLGENFKFIFSGADVEPLLKGLHAVLNIFNANGDAAKSLRATVTRMTEAAIGVILDLAIALVKGYIWLKQHETIWKAIGVAAKATAVGIGVAVGVVIATVTTIVGLMVAAAAVTGAFWALLVKGAIIAYEWLGKVSKQIVNAFPDLYEMGVNMVEGWIKGIQSSASRVYDAMVKVAKDAVQGAKSFLGISSPSMLMDRQVGYQQGAGQAQGHLRSIPLVRSAAETVAQASFETSVAATSAEASAAYSAQAGAGATMGAPAIGAPPVNISPQAAPIAPAPVAPAKALPSISFTNCNFGDNSEDALRKVIMSILEGELTDGGAPA